MDPAHEAQAFVIQLMYKGWYILRGAVSVLRQLFKAMRYLIKDCLTREEVAAWAAQLDEEDRRSSTGAGAQLPPPSPPEGRPSKRQRLE